MIQQTDTAAPAIDVDEIRANFPIFRYPENRDLIYLDNAATTQRPIQVLDAVRHFNEEYNSNIHRSAYKLAEKATAGYECARLQIAQFIGAKHAHEIIFTAGATQSLNYVAYGWAHKFLKSGDEILVTELEHHSNLVPWQIAAQKTGAKLKFLPIDGDGRLMIEKLDDLLTARTRLAAITHASNVLGTRVDVKRVIDAAHQVGALVVVDGVQHVPHSRVNVEQLDVDFYACSGHKMLGPMGIGILYAKEALLHDMDPVMFGGSMIDDVHHLYSTWAELPWKFEAGTPNIAGGIGLGAAMDYLCALGLENVYAHEQRILAYALEKLLQIKGLEVYGPRDTKDRLAVISFNLQGVHPHDVAGILDEAGIAVRSGHHCAQPLMKRLGMDNTARASFYIYNSEDDVDALVDALKTAQKLFS